jgi:hypothetical protein
MSETATKTPGLKLILVVIVIMAGTSLRYFYNSGTLVDHPIRGDARNYVIYSNNLLEHATFSKETGTNSPSPDSYWAPGYPFFLASVVTLSELLNTDIYATIINSQLILGALALLFTFLLANIFLPGLWPILPTLLVALSPHLVSTAQYILTETLTGLLLLIALYFCAAGLKNSQPLKALLAGLFFALGYMTNPVTSLTAPLLAALICIKTFRGAQEKKQQSRKFAALMVAPLIIAVSLWSIRGAINVPPDAPSSSSRLMTNLVQGMDPDFHESRRSDRTNANNAIKMKVAATENSYRGFIKILGSELMANPANILVWYLVEKPILLWDWNIRVGMGDIYIYPVFYSLYQTSGTALITYSLMKSLHFWIFGCAVLSILFIIRNDRQDSLITAAIYLAKPSISAIYVISQAEPRYSIPLRPEMYILGTYFLWELIEKFKKYRSKNND